jgi:lia operon protein LiaF
MLNKGQVLIGILFILIGLLFLIGTVFDVDVGVFCFPLALIGIGVWLLVRPHMVGPGTAIQQKVLGDIRRDGAWEVVDEEFWIGVGDVDLDMTGAEIPIGETRLRVFGFVGDVDVLVPEGVGVSVSSMAFLTNGKILGRRQESFVTPVRVASDDYEAAERKVRLETTFFVTELKVRRKSP